MQASAPICRPGPGFRVEGHAIVSADGMIADAAGAMPAQLHNDADWRAFQAALDAAAVVVLGRRGHQRHPNPGRRRLVLTGAVAGLAPDPAQELALLWNPAGAPLAAALAALGVGGGTIAVTGGTRVFGLFLPCYDSFALSECHRVVLPGGTPCFAAGHPRQVLAASGLAPDANATIDAAAGVTTTLWRRPG